MAFSITDRAARLFGQNNIEPNLVLEIEGYPYLFGTQVGKINPYFDQPDTFFDEPGLFFDRILDADDFKDYIQINGTTQSIAQQLEPDKGAATSTQTMNIRVIDFEGQVSRLVSPGKDVEDILYRKARVWLGPRNGAFPTDYVLLIDGNIQAMNYLPAAIEFVVSHPDDAKRAEVFPKQATKLTQPAFYKSAQIQSLLYRQRGDVSGTVEVQYLNNQVTDVAIVSVLANIITVGISAILTRASTVKKAIENSADANQLVTVELTGNSGDIQVAQALTPMEVSDTLDIEDASLFFNPLATPLLKTYAKIGTELIEYTNRDLVTNQLQGCTRAALTSFGDNHEIGDDVTTFYKLGDASAAYGNAISLALWLLMSGAPEVYRTDSPNDFVDLGPSIGIVPNGILFRSQKLITYYNVQAGDQVRTALTVNGANSFAYRTIVSVTEYDDGTVIVVDGAALVTETSTTGATAEFKSQWNVLPDGMGLLPGEVDIAQFELIRSRYGSALANYEIYLKETIKAKDLLNLDILLPSAMYSVPRKGRVSVGITSPPLYDEGSKTVTLAEVLNPSEISVARSSQKNFYNAVLYTINEDSVEDKLLTGVLTLSGNSISRIPAPTRALEISARGLRPGAATSTLIRRNSNRFLNRYEFGAEYLRVQLPFSVGWPVEVGDAMVFGDSDLPLTDTSAGERGLAPRIYEVTNKEWNWKTGFVRVELTDTNYSQSVRYGVFSPTSKVAAGSTTTEVQIKRSFNWPTSKQEPDKWEPYVGKLIVVHSPDWTTQYIGRIASIGPTSLRLNAPLAGVPPEDYLVDVPAYDDLDVASDVYKRIYDFFTPQLSVVSGVSSTQFNVSAPDAAKLFVGSPIRVHSDDYTIDSGERAKKVTDVTGTLITCTDLGFVPSLSQKIDLVGFVSDEGAAYAWL